MVQLEDLRGGPVRPPAGGRHAASAARLAGRPGPAGADWVGGSGLLNYQCSSSWRAGGRRCYESAPGRADQDVPAGSPTAGPPGGYPAEVAGQTCARLDSAIAFAFGGQGPRSRRAARQLRHVAPMYVDSRFPGVSQPRLGQRIATRVTLDATHTPRSDTPCNYCRYSRTTTARSATRQLFRAARRQGGPVAKPALPRPWCRSTR